MAKEQTSKIFPSVFALKGVEKTVPQGRKKAAKDFNAYFVDDENSHPLFFSYAAAALCLKQQLKVKNLIERKASALRVVSMLNKKRFLGFGAYLAGCSWNNTLQKDST